MSAIAESIIAVTSSASPLILGVIALSIKSKFRNIVRRFDNFEQGNKRDHKEIVESVQYINSRNTLTKALTKVCNSSIAYTEGANEINTFKTVFTNAIIGLSMATLTSGFKFISKDIFHGYMDVAGNKIIAEYPTLPKEFVPILRTHIQEASKIYYEHITCLISDKVFNDKHDRFVDYTISFLRKELMIVTQHWWSYSKTDSTYVEID